MRRVAAAGTHFSHAMLLDCYSCACTTIVRCCKCSSCRGTASSRVLRIVGAKLASGCAAACTCVCVASSGGEGGNLAQLLAARQCRTSLSSKCMDMFCFMCISHCDRFADQAVLPDGMKVSVLQHVAARRCVQISQRFAATGADRQDKVYNQLACCWWPAASVQRTKLKQTHG
ncbi:hypothetical protein COO60DRAFT_269616 [Scenedesmus sp. NREL 46B-D3]|nr:hypothetical protein COO60DRAFT_269616 [Scenedesmus sp. NREL 46B-D3]